jgi:hypothetical protein
MNLSRPGAPDLFLTDLIQPVVRLKEGSQIIGVEGKILIHGDPENAVNYLDYDRSRPVWDRLPPGWTRPAREFPGSERLLPYPWYDEETRPCRGPGVAPILIAHAEWRPPPPATQEFILPPINPNSDGLNLPEGLHTVQLTFHNLGALSTTIRVPMMMRHILVSPSIAYVTDILEVLSRSSLVQSVVLKAGSQEFLFQQDAQNAARFWLDLLEAGVPVDSDAEIRAGMAQGLPSPSPKPIAVRDVETKPLITAYGFDRPYAGGGTEALDRKERVVAWVLAEHGAKISEVRFYIKRLDPEGNVTASKEVGVDTKATKRGKYQVEVDLGSLTMNGSPFVEVGGRYRFRFEAVAGRDNKTLTESSTGGQFSVTQDDPLWTNWGNMRARPDVEGGGNYQNLYNDAFVFWAEHQERQWTNVDLKPAILKAIAAKESRMDPNAANENRRGDGTVASRDWGIMQVNDFWWCEVSGSGRAGCTGVNPTDSERAFWLDPDVNIAAGAYALAESYDTINQHNRGKVNRDKPERQVSESDSDNFAIYGYHRGGAELSAVLKNLAGDATPESPLTWDKFAGAPEKYNGSAEGVQYVNDVNSRLNPPTEGGLPKDAGNT